MVREPGFTDPPPTPENGLVGPRGRGRRTSLGDDAVPGCLRTARPAPVTSKDLPPRDRGRSRRLYRVGLHFRPQGAMRERGVDVEVPVLLI